jgi:hypothetical protein
MGTEMSLRRLSACVAIVLLCLAGASTAAASWSSNGTGSSYAKASSLPTPAAPTTAVSGRNVTVSWTAPAGGAPLTGYSVSRQAATGGAVQTIKSNCSGTIAGVTCVEQNVPSGSWTYTVRTLNGNWSGADSAKSANAVVGSATLQLTGSTTLASLPATLSGSISNFESGQTATFRLDNATTGSLLTGSITPSTTPAGGGATVSVTIPSGTANGAHTVYAIGSNGDVASAGVTVAVPSSLTTSAWNLRDASSGTLTDSSELTAFADARPWLSSSFASTFSTSRYVQFDLNDPLPAGQSVSGANFNFRFAATASTRTSCFYFDIRRVSTGTVLATDGSAASPIGCVTGTTQQTFTTSLAEVTSSAIADDLRVRVYVKDTGGSTINTDMATVTATSAGKAVTLYSDVSTDAATGTATAFPWGIATAGDSAAYTSLATWTTAFSATRYLSMTFPSYVPTGAAISGVTFKHVYRPETTGSTCYYFEVYSGATLLGTHGSSASPVSCNATTSYVTNTTSLPEVTTAAQANNLTIRVYVRNASSLKSQDDQDAVTITYVG